MPLNILCVSGSLRKGSILTGIVRYAIQSAPKTVNFEFLDLHGVPLYDGDIDPTEKRGPAKVWPPSVANLRSKVKKKCLAELKTIILILHLSPFYYIPARSHILLITFSCIFIPYNY